MADLDEEKILIKIDQLEGYLSELEEVLPETYEDYKTIEKRRSTERLLQLAIEAVIDTCNLVVSGLDLGLPSEENDLFDKLAEEGIISEDTKNILYEMRGFRNILVHEYATVDNGLVFEAAQENIWDFRKFTAEIKDGLKS
ncbi:DUF86 domain-containing protein [Candidatus Bipolaricaulota bacterium]|nr:DUF86 domain-containing protein [Candidatus Bipolaricaulota bacterium]